MAKDKMLSENEMKAKRTAIEAMRDTAEGMMGDKLKGLKKVTVASNDPAGLAAGLDKAKSMIEKSPSSLEAMDHSASDHGVETMHDQDCEDESCPGCGEDESAPSDEDAMKAKLMEHLGGDKHPMEVSSDDDSSDDEHMSEDELNAQLEKLMALKAKLRK